MQVKFDYGDIWLSGALIIIRKPKKSYFLREKGPELRNCK
jgi:hypothetical protein